MSSETGKKKFVHPEAPLLLERQDSNAVPGNAAKAAAPIGNDDLETRIRTIIQLLGNPSSPRVKHVPIPHLRETYGDITSDGAPRPAAVVHKNDPVGTQIKCHTQGLSHRSTHNPDIDIVKKFTSAHPAEVRVPCGGINKTGYPCGNGKKLPITAAQRGWFCHFHTTQAGSLQPGITNRVSSGTFDSSVSSSSKPYVRPCSGSR